MAITSTNNIPGKLARPFVTRNDETMYSGAADVTAGQTLTIETSPQGEELLTVTCPEGKVLHVTVRVQAVEADAA